MPESIGQDVPHDKYQRLIKAAQALPAIRVAIAHPCDDVSLQGAVEAARLRLIEPILVGPVERIRSVAKAAGLEIGTMDIVPSEHSHDSAAKSVELVTEGRVEALMKGSLHTDELMGAVVARNAGIRTARRISHCFVMDVPRHPNALIITDAAVNIVPTLDDKVDIVQNAIDLAHAMGVTEVRVALLSAMETVTAKVPSTIEAAALCKMADRGQITGALLDGPLALDNAISPEAAAIKQIVFARRRASECACRSGPGGWQHACQEPVVSGACGCRRHRTRRAGADHSDQPCGLAVDAARLLRRCRDGGSGAPPVGIGIHPLKEPA